MLRCPACVGSCYSVVVLMLAAVPLHAADALVRRPAVVQPGAVRCGRAGGARGSAVAGDGRWRARRARPHSARALPAHPCGCGSLGRHRDAARRRCASARRPRAHRAVDRAGRGAVPRGPVRRGRVRCSSPCSTTPTRSARPRTSACSTGGPHALDRHAQLRPVANAPTFTHGSSARMARRSREDSDPTRGGILAGGLGARCRRSRTRAERSDRCVGARRTGSRWRRRASRRSRSVGRAGDPAGSRRAPAGARSHAGAGRNGRRVGSVQVGLDSLIATSIS